MKIKNLKVGMFFLIGILLVSGVLAYSSSNPNYGLFNSYVGESSYDSQTCGAGQDFIIQIAPFGCTPAVVRSDLLEEQNVPVFCQLAATKINPMIDVNAIESISFSGEYPSSVSGIGFHPAQAALGVSGDINSPLLANIGYVVIVLKKEEVEKNMPDYVEGNLTARISYDIKNAFGIGKASFYLPTLTDEEFNQKKNQYSFWDGRGYLQVEGMDENGATILVSNDVGRISSVHLNKGETSNKIYIPGFECLASMQIKLDGLVAPDTRAKLDINGEIVEVSQGEYFLDNKCRVTKINKQGMVQDAQIYCGTDEGGKNFDLRIGPKVKLNFTGSNPDGYQLGDYLYQDTDGKSIYLGYIGTNRDSGKESDLYVYLIGLPTKKDKLSASEISSVTTLVNQLVYKKMTGVIAADVLLNVAKGIFGASNVLYQSVFNGKSTFSWLDYQKKQNIGGTDIELIGFSGAADTGFGGANPNSVQVPFNAGNCKIGSSVTVKDSGDFSYSINKRGTNQWESSLDDSELTDDEINKFYADNKISKYDPSCIKISSTTNSEAQTNYNNAMKDYENVLNSYSNEKCGDITCGEEALYDEIKLAFDNNQKLTAVNLCDKFKSAYPNSKKVLTSYCGEKWRIANPEISTQDIVINNVVKTISFKGIYEPTSDDYSATIKITGPNKKVDFKTLTHNQLLNLVGFREVNKDENEHIQLTGLTENTATIKYSLDTTGIGSKLASAFKTDTVTISLNAPQSFGGGYTFELTEVKLKNSAKVSLIPNIDNAGTSANFSFKIGIEKRAIQLSPEQTQEKIDNLNKTIADWDDKSEKLGKVVKGLKGACLATGAYLTIKNLVTNAGGKSIARQEVMKSVGGWNEKCAALVTQKKYSSIDECFFNNSKAIDNDVDTRYTAMAAQNEEIKKLEDGCAKTQFLTEIHVDTNCFKGKYAPVVVSELDRTIGDREIDVGGGEKVKASEILKGVNSSSVTAEDLRSLQLNSRLDSDMAQKQLNTDLKEIYANTKTQVEAKSFQDSADGITGGSVDVYGSKDSIQGTYRGAKATSDNWELDEGTPVQMITFNNQNYYLELAKSGTDTYAIKNVYDSDWTLLSDDKNSEQGIYDFNVATIKSTLGKGFKKYDSSTYENPFSSVSGETGVAAKFYDTDPYKGLPALVPFDLKKGWYAATKQTLPVLGGISSYDASGRVTSLWVCNVGPNKIAEFNSGIGDDICEQVNLGTGAPYNNFPGLSPTESAKIVRCAQDAIADASKYKSGSEVRVSTSCGGSISVKVGSPAVNVPEMQCTDYMSPSECKWLFNVCDPVICPSSRCDLGGVYPVRDVVQSGIIGSIALCLPNLKEGIYIPVCLTGIKAGIDSYLSVVKAHRDCLQESLDSGKTVGICDEIYSINLCEFFWRQGLPLAKLVIPKLIEVALGQNIHGGGEYLGVASAWKNAENSVNYFTQYYAANSFEAFKARTAEDVGSAICKSYVSAVYPEGGNLLDALTEPDSPSQFTGYFNEIPFTTVTVPPVSQYKVYYHIYAGEDAGAYYQVYLTEGDSSSYYQDTSYRNIVDSGYVTKGDYVDQTKDFTAPSGYKKLCIRVNEQEECGFKQVSTSYAINYVNDEYAKEQATQTDITTESECISGTASLYSLLQPNLQEGVNEVIDPAIYERGIIRICATDNPGKGTDESKWAAVGYCDNQKIKCWIDMDSVKKVIKDLDKQNQTLSTLANNSLSVLEAEGTYESRDTVEGKIKNKEELMNQGKYKEVINLVNEILGKTFWNDQKVVLLLNRAKAYSNLIPKIATQTSGTTTNDCTQSCSGYAYGTSGLNPDKCTTIQGTYLDNGCCCSNSNPEPISDGGADDTQGGGADTGTATTGLVCESFSCGGSSSSGQVMGGTDCWKNVGEQVINIANQIRDSKIQSNPTQYSYLTDSEVAKKIGVSSFGCLVAMVARQEGCLAHCVYDSTQDNPLYCDGNSASVLTGDGGDSVGIMQISKKMQGAHYGFTDNIQYAANLLISRYSSISKSYNCAGKNYAGWEKSLRYYNGWNTDCGKGDINYVENVLARKSEIISLFPECKVDSTKLCNDYCSGQRSSSTETFFSYPGLTQAQCDAKETDQNPYAYSSSLSCCCYYEKGLVAESSSDENNQ